MVGRTASRMNLPCSAVTYFDMSVFTDTVRPSDGEKILMVVVNSCFMATFSGVVGNITATIAANMARIQ